MCGADVGDRRRQEAVAHWGTWAISVRNLFRIGIHLLCVVWLPSGSGGLQLILDGKAGGTIKGVAVVLVCGR